MWVQTHENKLINIDLHHTVEPRERLTTKDGETSSYWQLVAYRHFPGDYDVEVIHQGTLEEVTQRMTDIETALTTWKMYI